jgi:hypothetical protein
MVLATKTAILVVSDVKIMMETQHSIPLLSHNDLSQVSFIFQICVFYLVIHLQMFGLFFVSKHVLHYSPPTILPI